MADDNKDNLYEDEVDEDLLTTIQRWTEKAQLEKQSREGQWPQAQASLGNTARMRNPWAPELAAAADRALQEEPQGLRERDGLPPLQVGAPPLRPDHGPKAGKEKKMKKKHPLRRFMAIALALVLLLGAGGYALAFAVAGKVDSQPIPDADRSALRAVTGSARVTNILLMGMDVEDGGRSDTMLLLSIDHVHRKLKLTSFLRDCWVTLPNGKSNRLNTAVFFGGPAMAMRAVSGSFNVRVDHYAAVGFEVFAQLVDALGGVSVPITEKEAKWLYKTAGPFKKMGGKDGLEEMRRQMKNWEMGTNSAVKLDGLQALVFCRIRKLDDDFMRTQRQRIFFECLVKAIKKNPLRLLGLLGDTLSAVQTDMTQAQLANLAALMPLLMTYTLDESTKRTVPFKGTYSNATKQGMSVITLDLPENARRLREFIYE